MTDLPSEWAVANNEKVNLGASGAELAFNKRFDAPTMRTNFNLFFGRVEYVVKAAPGTGIVSSMVLLSDDLDEVDWEFRGSITDSVQTNYFGKGYTGTYNRSTTASVATPQAVFHTYAIDWSPESLVWSIDGQTVRTLNAADADGNGSQYPQSPMKVSLSLWDGGDPDTNPGTVEWAGGLTSLPPAQSWTMYVQSVKIWNSNPGQQYQYTDKSGSEKSIKVINDTMTSSSSSAMQSTETLSLGPTAFPSTQSAGIPVSNITSPCSITSSMSTATSTQATIALNSATAVLDSASLSSSNGNSTVISAGTLLSNQSTHSSSALARSASQTTTSGSVASVSSISGFTAAVGTLSSSPAAVSAIYTQSPLASALGTSIVPQVAAPSVASVSASSTSPTALPSSAAATSSSLAAAASVTPNPDDTSDDGNSNGLYTGDPNSSADSESNGPVDGGDSITDIPPSTTYTADGESTQTAFETQPITSTLTSMNATAAPYPYSNASYVPASGSMASTGATGSASGFSKATTSPIAYSSNGLRVRVSLNLALSAAIAGTMASLHFLL